MVEQASQSLWLSAAAVVLLWWAGTGIVLRLNRLAPQQYGAAMIGATVLAVAGLLTIYVSSSQVSLSAQLASFCGTLALWAWIEISYYLGYVTGTSNAPCPPGVSKRRRFTLALCASLYHELAVVAGAVLVALLSFQAAQFTALWCYLVLCCMRWSTKLNIFFGVSNINEGWLPPALKYLASFYEKRSMNLFFPVSVTLATAVLVLCLQSIPGAPPAQQISASFVVSLLALGILEHWFLVIPLPNTALWEPVFGTEGSAINSDGEGSVTPGLRNDRVNTTLQNQPLAAGGTTR